ncbi:dTDP-4-dehydrorhamnose 3,5-epimerase [Sphingobacterium allocomposti]|uniref:dTDP-4-dehydrorhamnose 3,5-epimerase n=1 Tax=Sphingobacterium allocomposti TaxID=415956 RepID=A0A5S5DG24_9SPHI|nr:WxcM-like domain-containing protein [Sphingobacterium composti Yoo et al. 2007 non Ten et al. 2007]TYP94604.1 dTDP-4-dehydrorhamnose 3,5-epimerase [Sphingobacterium composti Yoo et al. 2007 non Ten et al. 2007]
MIEFIQGGAAKDHRGQIRFVNDFDMSSVKRFYIIKNSDLELVRGWRAHRLEQRWFYVLSGKFAVDLVAIDNWERASSELPVEKIILDAEENKVLHLSTGYGTAFQALETNSELLVFSDYGIENAPHDDYTYPLDYFINRKPVISI